MLGIINEYNIAYVFEQYIKSLSSPVLIAATALDVSATTRGIVVTPEELREAGRHHHR